MTAGVASTPYGSDRAAPMSSAPFVWRQDGRPELSALLPDAKSTHAFAHEKHTKAPEGAAVGAATGVVAEKLRSPSRGVTTSTESEPVNSTATPVTATIGMRIAQRINRFLSVSVLSVRNVAAKPNKNGIVTSDT